MSDLTFHLVDQVLLGLVGGQAGDALEHLGLAALNGFELFFFAFQLGIFFLQILFLLFDQFGLVIEVFFLLLQTALLLLLLGAAFLDFLLVFSSVTQNFFLGLQKCLALFVLGALDGFVINAQRLVLGVFDGARIFLFLGLNDQNTSEDAKSEGDDRQNDGIQYGHGVPPICLCIWRRLLRRSADENRDIPLKCSDNAPLIILPPIMVNCQGKLAPGPTILCNLPPRSPPGPRRPRRTSRYTPRRP